MTSVVPEDELFYVRAMRRIYGNILWLTIAGTVAAAWLASAAWAFGFLLGAAVSAINFRWLHRLADSVSPDRDRKPSRGLGFVLSFRYLLLGGVGYVIVRFFGINILGALVGLFVAVAAVMVELAYELIYARA